MMSANLEFEIEELVLHGFPVHDRPLIRATIQQELTRLFAARGISPEIANHAEIGHFNGGAFEVVTGMLPTAIGIQIAESIYTLFSNENVTPSNMTDRAQFP